MASADNAAARSNVIDTKLSEVFVANAAKFSQRRTPAKVVGRTPTSGAGPLAGHFGCAEACSFNRTAGRGRPAQTRGLPHSTSAESQHWENYVALGFQACHAAKFSHRRTPAKVCGADALVRGRPPG